MSKNKPKVQMNSTQPLTKCHFQICSLLSPDRKICDLKIRAYSHHSGNCAAKLCPEIRSKAVGVQLPQWWSSLHINTHCTALRSSLRLCSPYLQLERLHTGRRSRSSQSLDLWGWVKETFAGVKEGYARRNINVKPGKLLKDFSTAVSQQPALHATSWRLPLVLLYQVSKSALPIRKLWFTQKIANAWKLCALSVKPKKATNFN